MPKAGDTFSRAFLTGCSTCGAEITKVRMRTISLSEIKTPDGAKFGMSAVAPSIARRSLLCDMAALILGAVSTSSFAQHGGPGLVTPPVRLDDTWLVVHTGRKRLLSDFLRHGATELQTISTVWCTRCPLPG